MDFTISTIIKGFIAGFIGTLVITMLMMAKSAMGVMPDFNVIAMLMGLAHKFLDIAPSADIGWMLHFGIGTIAWGGAFAIFNKEIPGHTQLKKGLVFGVLAWFLMLITVFPMAGGGWFGMHLGMKAVMAALMLHLAYGLGLGISFRVLTKTH